MRSVRGSVRSMRGSGVWKECEGEWCVEGVCEGEWVWKECEGECEGERVRRSVWESGVCGRVVCVEECVGEWYVWKECEGEWCVW